MNVARIDSYITKWRAQGYPEGLPDEAPSKLEAINKAPSYRKICKAILSNDLHMTSLGFSRPQVESYGVLKRIELEERKRIMNVCEAATKRIEKVFDEFDNVYVSFSGGKDSGVMLNLAIEVAKKRGRTIGVFHIDYEAQYQMTTDYVDEVLSNNLGVIEPYRICLPISAQCATSAYADHWVPWDRDKRELWVRDLPATCINDMNHEFPWFKKGMWDYDLQERFAAWYHEKKGAKRTACLVGIRTDESLNRWRAIHSDKNQNKFDGNAWTLEMFPGIYNAYPIFDWKVSDVWVANARFGWSYNKLYDLFYKAGLTPAQMRVASPFNNCATESLKLYKVIDPANWGKMIGRTSGVNFAGIYGGTTAMGWRSIQLPKGHTWKSYMEFLLSTLPKQAAENYLKKLEFSKQFWRTKGGCLSESLIAKLKALGVEHEVCEPGNRSTKKPPVRMEYVDDIDLPEFQQIPSYKRMCVCILKNDHLCKYMGFSLSKTETELREAAENKYKNVVSQKGKQDA
jgi:predicted phosphoadenosine phosphosulfate sulfurtransferase